jgi:hypothetical protein
MLRHLGELLRPFRAQYRVYITGVILRQALFVVGGYALVWTLRSSPQLALVPVWAFVAAFIL